MILNIVGSVLNSLFFFALHIDSKNVFPKPLSKQEEEECFKKMQEGDESARNKLIEHNLRLVAHIIKKYYSNLKDQDELISIGTIGTDSLHTQADVLKKQQYQYGSNKSTRSKARAFFKFVESLSKSQRLFLYFLSVSA